MPPVHKRRRLSPVTDDTPSQTPTTQPSGHADPTEDDDNKDGSRSTTTTAQTTSTTSADRLARFAALKARATQSARSNLSEAKAEAQRSALDPQTLSNLARKRDIAAHNLLKADVEAEEGQGAFERKRAWDYTVEESEKWDERVARKREAREKNEFQDYAAEAARVYERQIRELEKTQNARGGTGHDEEYQAQKRELIEEAARNGGLEIVETTDGELVAIDKDGRFFANGTNTGFVEQKPKKENIDRLVADLQKAEEVSLRKRRERRGEQNDGDVTYINEKNRQFNMKLARFYDRYTTDIRDSFERGTAI